MIRIKNKETNIFVRKKRMYNNRTQIKRSEVSFMIYHIMFKDTLVADVITNQNHMVQSIQTYVENGPTQPFWNVQNDSPAKLTSRFYAFLKDRCYEDNRANLQDILHSVGLETNNPYEWIKISHGVTYEDFFWIRFEGESITWNDVKVRD